jgi:hypothetical protein
MTENTTWRQTEGGGNASSSTSRQESAPGYLPGGQMVRAWWFCPPGSVREREINCLREANMSSDGRTKYLLLNYIVQNLEKGVAPFGSALVRGGYLVKGAKKGDLQPGVFGLCSFLREVLDQSGCGELGSDVACNKHW